MERLCNQDRAVRGASGPLGRQHTGSGQPPLHPLHWAPPRPIQLQKTQKGEAKCGQGPLRMGSGRCQAFPCRRICKALNPQSKGLGEQEGHTGQVCCSQPAAPALRGVKAG